MQLVSQPSGRDPEEPVHDVRWYRHPLCELGVGISQILWAMVSRNRERECNPIPHSDGNYDVHPDLAMANGRQRELESELGRRLAFHDRMARTARAL